MAKTAMWGVGVVLALGITASGCAKRDQAAAAEVRPTAAAGDPARGDRSAPVAGSMREVRVQLEVLLATGTSAHAAIAAFGDLAASSGGYVASSSFGENETGAHTVLRIPPNALSAVRRAAGALGAIGRDNEAATDVTEAITDLDARLRAGRTEETRLLALVDQRTGTVADVLAAERVLAEVRERIERLDAEARAAHGRVDLATIDISLIRTAVASETGVLARLASAAQDGAHDAGALSVELAIGMLRMGPSIALVGALFAAAIALVRRWRARRVAA